MAALVMAAGHAKAADQCVTNMVDLASAPEVKRILALFGGADNMQGSWKLAGLAGSFVQAKVKFENRVTTFWTQYNDEPANQIYVCAGDDKQSLKLVVYKPIDPNNKVIIIKPVPNSTDLMLVSAHQSGWKFVKFKKIQSLVAKQ